MKKQHKVNELGYITLEHFLEIFQVSRRTAQNWRDDGITPFTKIGGKVYYKLSEIEELMAKR